MTSNRKSSILVFFVVALAPMFWAGNIVLGRGIAMMVPPVSLAFWRWAVAILGANRTSLFITLIPVFAAILAILFLGETLHAFHLAGMVLILIGFVMFNR